MALRRSLRRPRLTRLPPVEAIKAEYNLPLRFRSLWPKPHLGLPLNMFSSPPWPSEVWEAIAASLDAFTPAECQA